MNRSQRTRKKRKPQVMAHASDVAHVDEPWMSALRKELAETEWEFQWVTIERIRDEYPEYKEKR